jgi:AcrR family transcriptional regulator
MREQILEIAEDQMKAGGYGYLNFGLISKELNTTRANLHYHFNNKETLAIEVTKRFMADQKADLEKLMAQYGDDFPKLVLGMEEYLWAHHEKNGQVGACVCSKIISQPEAPESLLQLAREHFEIFQGTLIKVAAESKKNGKLKKDCDPKRVAIEAACVMGGLAKMTLILDPSEHKALKGTLKHWIKSYLP